MKRARVVQDLADQIDAMDAKIADIETKKTTAEANKNNLIKKYYDSGKKEEAAPADSSAPQR